MRRLTAGLSWVVFGTAALGACAGPVADNRYGDFRPTSWQLVGAVTPDASQLTIDVHAHCSLANPYVRTAVTYGIDNITIAATVAEVTTCPLIAAYWGEVRCVVQLKEPVGNRELLGLDGSRRSPAPVPDRNETAGPGDTTERPLPPGHATPPRPAIPTANGTCLPG